jgi:hypothetical protein
MGGRVEHHDDGLLVSWPPAHAQSRPALLAGDAEQLRNHRERWRG